MSKPKNDWWINAINMVRNYPTRKQEYEELHSQSFGASSGMPSSGSNHQYCKHCKTSVIGMEEYAECPECGHPLQVNFLRRY